MRIDEIVLATYDEVDSTIFAALSLDQTSRTDRYILQQAYGLDVEEAFPKLYGNFGTLNYRQMSMEPRDIALKVKLNPRLDLAERAGDLRDPLYRMISFDRSSLVELRFLHEGVVRARIHGFVKKFESDIFTDNPTVQITFQCDYPFLRGPDDIEMVGSPGVVVPAPIIIDQSSTAPHGFKMQLRVTASIPTSFTIQGVHGTTEAPFKILRGAGAPFVADDIINFSSEQDNKYLYMVRNGVVSLLVDTIDVNQVWPILFPGTNQLGFSTSNIVIESLTYYPHYWGI